MAAVVSLVVVVTLGLIITRVATVAFTLTGMPLHQARFQARSALTGTGFTTSEAEAVVNHPARRRVVMILMMVGGAGAVSVIGAVLLSFGGVDSTSRGLQRAALIVGCLLVLLWLARSEPIDRVLRAFIERLLRRYSSSWNVPDYTALLHVRGQWQVSQLPVRPDDWVASRPLGELGLPAEGVAVLGVERAGEDDRRMWIGAPHPDLRLQDDDVVVMYGRRSTLEELARRAAGARGDDASARSQERQRSSPLDEPL